MKNIILYGALTRFGERFYLDVQTAKEATHALACQMPEFKRFMLDAEQNGMRFAVFIDDKNIGADELEMTTSAETIHIVPKIMGAGGDTFGWLQVIGGALLVGAGLFMPGLAAFAPALIGAGAGLMIGGAASLLMPSPEVEPNDPDGNKANYGFGGPVTTIAQGNPVPVLYGQRMVGGFVASAGIYAEDNQ